jgi:predicted nucleic acid-binding protein
MPHLELVPLDMAIATEAARLRGAYGARTPDAVHAATALASRADVLVSNDQRLRALAGEPISLWLFDDAAR